MIDTDMVGMSDEDMLKQDNEALQARIKELEDGIEWSLYMNQSDNELSMKNLQRILKGGE